MLSDKLWCVAVAVAVVVVVVVDVVVDVVVAVVVVVLAVVLAVDVVVAAAVAVVVVLLLFDVSFVFRELYPRVFLYSRVVPCCRLLLFRLLGEVQVVNPDPLP